MNNLPLDITHTDPCRNKTERQILLVEPNYRNKYPPLGLMKLSAYHKQLSDTVVFFKGEYSEYLFAEKLEKCLFKIKQQGFTVENWDKFENLVRNYLKYHRKAMRQEILELVPLRYFYTVENILLFYARRYSPERKWDRVYITTLFTFYWKKTIAAIEFAKKVVKTIGGLYVGGVAASLIPDLLAEETGLSINHNIITGLLDKPGVLDDNDIIIDEIAPDYSILETINYHYPFDTGYLAYMTRGCKRRCSFCAVPKLESYKGQISIKNQIKLVAERHGNRKDLILLDSNVLGSPKFPEIIQEILDMGFAKGATFVEPNRFVILTNYLLEGDNQHNEQKYLERVFQLLIKFGNRITRYAKVHAKYYQLLQNRGLDSWTTFTKERLLDSIDEINEFIEKYRNKAKKLRYVDFNQGIDCRYVNEENMKLLSQLPIRPMRIAFDSLTLRKPYENAIRLADKYGVRRLSNYILFNYQDKPDEFWQRLKINIDLNEELKAKIYSFPMKYIPVCGKDSTNRSYIGAHWNRKYLRAIGTILTVTGGIVTVSPPFFERAFGKTLDEFHKILMMPEPYIRYRNHFEQNGETAKWFEQFNNLSSKERKEAEKIIHSNKFSINNSTSKAVAELMKHYQVQYRPDK